MTNRKDDEQISLFWKGRWWGYDVFSPINWIESNRDLVRAVDAPAGGLLLDIGCGSGKGLVENLAWLRAGGRLVATDPDPTALTFMRRVAARFGVGSQVDYVRAGAQELGELGTARFDGAYSHFALDKIAGVAARDAAFVNSFALLKPGARLAVAVPSTGFNRKALAAHIRWSERHRTDIGSFRRRLRGDTIAALTLHFNKKVDANFQAGIFHRFSADELRDHFKRAGFVEVSLRHIDGMNAFHVVGTKPRPIDPA